MNVEFELSGLRRGCLPSERVAARLSLTAGTSRKDVLVASDLSLGVPIWEVEKTVSTGHAGRIVAFVVHHPFLILPSDLCARSTRKMMYDYAVTRPESRSIAGLTGQ